MLPSAGTSFDSLGQISRGVARAAWGPDHMETMDLVSTGDVQNPTAFCDAPLEIGLSGGIQGQRAILLGAAPSLEKSVVGAIDVQTNMKEMS